MGRHPFLKEQTLSGASTKIWLDYMQQRLNGDLLPDGRVIGGCSGARLKEDMTYRRTVIKHAHGVLGSAAFR